MDDFEDLIEGYEPPQVEEYEPPRKKRTAKKPTLPVEKRQVFTPKLPEQPFGKGSFKFETTPFRETPESYQLRSKESPTGEERLRREEMLSIKRGKPLKYARQATTTEAKELESAQAEQEIYDKFGPAAYGVRKGVFNLFKGTTEPFTQSAEEFVSIPGDVKALATGGVESLRREQAARDRVRQLSFDRNVIRKRESLFERGLPTLIEVGGNLLLNPRAPKQSVSGFRPPLDLGRGSREPLALPPGPPPQGSSSRSRPTQTYRPTPTPLDFYMVPSMGPNKAPVMIVPDWLISRLSGGRAEDIIGFNITTIQRDAIKNSIATSPARPEVKEYAWMQMEKLLDAADKAGVNSISIMNEGYDRASLVSSVLHETFHSGQNQAVKDTNRRLFGNKVADEMPTAIEMLHDSEWAKQLPVIKTLIENNPGLVEALGSTTGFEPHDILRAELPAYTMEGRGYLFFETSADAIDDLFDYFMHVADRNGVEALDVIQATATIRPGMEDAIPLARSMYENWQRERRERGLSLFPSESAGAGQLSDTSTSIQGAASGGIESRSGEGRVVTPSSETAGDSKITDYSWTRDQSDGPYNVITQRANQAVVYPNSEGSFDSYVNGKNLGTFSTLEEAQSIAEQQLDQVEVSIGSLRRRVPGLARAIEEDLYAAAGYELSQKELDNEIDNIIRGYGHLGKSEYADYVREAFPEKVGEIEDIRRRADENRIEKQKEGRFESLSEEELARRDREALLAIPEGRFAKADLGDLVKIKGYSQSAEVVGEGDEPGTMKVKFPDGTIDEFDVNDLKQKGKKMKDPMVQKLKENPPGPPPDSGAEVYGPRTPLRVPSIATTYQEAIARKFVDLLTQEKLDVDITDPPSKQIYEALVAGDLRDELVDQVLKEEGVTWEQFIEDQLQSYSKAGRDLSILSRLERDLERMLKNEPEKFGKYVAPKKQLEVILRVLNRSVLGRSLWSRYGGLIQKMVLTKLTTALVNTRTTMARAAVDVASEGLGAWMQNMSEGKGKFWDRVKESKDEAIEAMGASWEIVRALNPGQLEALLNRNKRIAYQEHQEIITQLEKFFPAIHAKLFARPISGETQQRVDAEKYVNLANSLLPRVKNATTRRDMKNQVKVIENRLKFEKSVWGKITLRGPEIAYDTMLIPMQFAEFLFRRPKFIGRLRLELLDRGIELDEVLRQTALTPEEMLDIPLEERMAFKDIPEEAITSALNNTLELTYAYDPSTDKEAPIMERAAGYFIKTMNALGPGAILGELFPRAIYNGMKTLYEYSPAPFLTATPELLFGSRGKSPIAKILRPSYEEDPKTKTKYKTHPPTRYDWERLAKAMIGSLMLFVAWDMIRQGEIGDEWWQLGDPKKRDAEGQSTYYDVRKDRPFSEYFHLASLAERYRRGTLGDKQLGNELLEIYTGIRRTDASPDFLDTINAAGELFGTSPQSPGRKLAMIEAGGRNLAIPFTPILNLRDIWAIYSEEENRLKDTRGIWYGPIQDKFPWWRRSLPDLTSPIEPSPMVISKDPDLLMSTGMQFTEGPNFAGREWQRLGLNYKNFLERDPDPSMNRAQNIYFEREIRRVGDMFENLPYYQDADDETKAAIWEQVVGGDNGLAAQAQQFATLANPMEAEARKLQGRMPGRLQRKKYGLDKVLQGIRDIGDERR